MSQNTVTMLARWEHHLSTGVLEHVERATPEEAVLYLGVVGLWLLGVAAVIARKLRMAR